MNARDLIVNEIHKAQKQGFNIDRIVLSHSFYETLNKGAMRPLKINDLIYGTPFSTNGIKADFELYYQNKKLRYCSKPKQELIKSP